MIFLDEMVTPSTSNDVKFMNGICEELKLDESVFDRFENPNCGFELVYEMEVASNELNMHFLKEEFQLLREEEAAGGEKKEGFWAKVVAKIKEWWQKFKAFMGRVWKAIKRFFKGIYEFLFKHQLWAKKRERLKSLAAAKEKAKFEASIFNTKAVQDLIKELAAVKADGEKAVADLNAKIAKDEAYEKSLKDQLAENFKKIAALREQLGKVTAKQIADEKAVEKSLKEAESAEGMIKQCESLADAYSALSLKYGAEADKLAEEAKKAYSSKKPADGNKLRNQASLKRSAAEEMKNAAQEVVTSVSRIKAAVTEAGAFKAAA